MALIKTDSKRCQVRTIEPLVNIREENNEIILEAEMVGLTKDDLSVELKGNELYIRGRSKQQLEDIPKGYTVLLRERCPFEYERSFLIGDDIDKDKIEASYENGVLKVKLVRLAKEQPKKIEIKE